MLKIFETSVDGHSFKVNNGNHVWKLGIYGVPAVWNVFYDKKIIISLPRYIL